LTDLLIIADYSEFAGQLFTSGRILQYKLSNWHDSRFYRIYMILQD
jgi:hypothetical protein